MTATAQWNDRVRRRLKLRDVDILLAVIQTGSMGKAAGVLNISQPAVSKAIAYLEHTLGVRLLDRSREGVEPTPYGRALIKRGVRNVRRVATGRSGHRVPYRSGGRGDTDGRGASSTISAIYSSVVHKLLATISADGLPYHRSGTCERCPGNWTRGASIFLASRMYSHPSEEHSVEVLFEDPLVVVTGPHKIRWLADAKSSLPNCWTSRGHCSLARTILGPSPWMLFTMQALPFHESRSRRHRVICAARCFRPAAISQWFLAIGSCCLLEPIAQSFTDRISRHGLKSRDHYFEESVSNRSTELFIDRVRAITKPLAKKK